ncbi:hypothetical protein [Winogradskyella schleiferi]|uniref:hypothetical protein n=1 Tax=Winogradskyella schleiferi TaxID=2686078 RepID=UPI0015BC6574|nr:hypothetical protein [Winogradskyella schleiferi]
MKNYLIKAFFILFTINMSHAQPWMTNLEIAQSLAKVQNKMVLMVWEEATTYPYHVLVELDDGRTAFIQNMFEDETVSPLIWKHFVPVIVNENRYADWYPEIKGRRSQKYIDKFNDDSIKIMDIHGNILNVSSHLNSYQNISTLIRDYALNTEFIEHELKGYQIKKDFYSAYYLASKYLDFSMYLKEDIRKEIIDLSNIYLDEAARFIEANPEEDQLALTQRVELLKIQEYLITQRPKKVLRQLRRMDAKNVEPNNQTFAAFLYYTAYQILNDENDAAPWKSKLSSVNLKKAQMLINLNS